MPVPGNCMEDNVDSLVLKNVLGFVKSEPVYFFAMTVIASVIFAFNSMVFSNDVEKLCSQSLTMDILLFFSDGVIIIANSWLIHYIMEYIFKKRSKEFALYMVFGKKRKEIFWLYIKETFLQVLVSWTAGVIAGFILWQFIIDIFCHLFCAKYRIFTGFSPFCIVFSFIIYIVPYIISLACTRKKFMQIGTEKSFTGKNKIKKTKKVVKNKKAFITERFNSWFYKNNRLFLYRIVVTELKGMKKIVLIIVLLLSSSLSVSTIAMFYMDYLEQQIDIEFPYSLMVYHDNPEIYFDREKKVLNKKKVKIKSEHEYVIYKSNAKDMRNLLYKNLDYFEEFIKENGSVITEEILENNQDYDVYYKYDTYMALSDYNKLRKMLSLPEKTLGNSQYILQVKHRIFNGLSPDITKRTVKINGKKLKPKETCTDNFGQNGHNGADYIIVVPDNIIPLLKPYFTVYAVQAYGKIPVKVSNALWNLDIGNENFRYGSNHSILFESPVLLKPEIEKILKSTVSVIIFPFAYVSIILLCIALSVMSIQVLSSLNLCTARYQVLYKLGMKQHETGRLVHKQLALIFIIPAVIAFASGGGFSLYINQKLIYNTGMYVSNAKYLLLSLFWILFIYLMFYILTDIIFSRSIRKNILTSLSKSPAF